MSAVPRLALAPQRAPGWRLWFLWLVANAWGWGVGMFTPFGQPGGIETLQSSPGVVWAGLVTRDLRAGRREDGDVRLGSGRSRC